MDARASQLCPKVLVVDDEPQVRGLLVRFLSGLGLCVREASSADEALAVIREEPFDVVISDIRMPGRDGFSLMRDVRAKDPDAEVILITGFGEMEDAVRALREGASDFIAKPFDLALVEHAVRRSAERRHLRALAKEYTLRLEREVEQRTKELREANEQLARLSTTREHFLTLIAHELKTPLAGMGLAQMALEEIDTLGREEICDYLRGILEAFRRLHRFSEAALLYSRLASGAMVLSPEPVDLADLVTRELDRCTERAGLLGLQISWERPPHPVEVQASAQLLGFTVRALLDNAVKYNHPGGRVEVGLEAVQGRFCLTVRDTGHGIRPEEKDLLFQPLAGVDVMHRRAGTGLSLAISALVAKAHGMELECASEGEGKGATFTLKGPTLVPPNGPRA